MLSGHRAVKRLMISFEVAAARDTFGNHGGDGEGARALGRGPTRSSECARGSAATNRAS